MYKHNILLTRIWSLNCVFNFGNAENRFFNLINDQNRTLADIGRVIIFNLMNHQNRILLPINVEVATLTPGKCEGLLFLICGIRKIDLVMSAMPTIDSLISGIRKIDSWLSVISTLWKIDSVMTGFPSIAFVLLPLQVSQLRRLLFPPELVLSPLQVSKI